MSGGGVGTTGDGLTSGSVQPLPVPASEPFAHLILGDFSVA
jgi:hypothetical protein